MAKKKKDEKDTIAQLEELATEIAEKEGDENGALTLLAKGTFLAIAALAKGKDMPEDEPEPEDEPNPEDEPEDDDGDPQPGYEDMRMGEGGVFDVSEFLGGIDKKLANIQTRLGKLEKSAVSKDDLASLRTDMGGALAEMAKGSMLVQEKLMDVAAPAVDHDRGGVGGGPRHGRKVLRFSGALGKAGALTKAQLYKARQQAIITEDDARHYAAHGAFPCPADKNKEITERITAL